MQILKGVCVLVAVPKVERLEERPVELTPEFCISLFAGALLGETSFFRWSQSRGMARNVVNSRNLQVEFCDGDGGEHTISADMPLVSVDTDRDVLNAKTERVESQVIELELDGVTFWVSWGYDLQGNPCVWYAKQTNPMPKHWIEFRESSKIYSERSLAITSEGILIHPERI